MIFASLFILSSITAFQTNAGPLHIDQFSSRLDQQKYALIDQSLLFDSTSGGSYLNTRRDKPIEIGIFFGFNDTKNSMTLDTLEMQALSETLTSSCESHFYACGFNIVQKTQNKIELYKVLLDGQEVLIELYSSSLSNNTQRAQHPSQPQWSHHVHNKFITELTQKDFVFYLGHSRKGGGPDFFYPKYTHSGRIDYSFYQRRQRGHNALFEGLKRAQQLKLLAIISCDSKDHFSVRIKQEQPELKIVSVKRPVPPSIAEKTLLTVLNSTLSPYSDQFLRESLDNTIFPSRIIDFIE